MTQFAQFIELLGDEMTLKLVERFGGTRITVSQKGPARQEIVEALGETGFLRLWTYFGGGEMTVPLAKRWRAVIYDADGLTHRDIARRLGWAENTVYLALREAKENGGALTMVNKGGRAHKGRRRGAKLPEDQLVLGFADLGGANGR